MYSKSLSSLPRVSTTFTVVLVAHEQSMYQHWLAAADGIAWVRVFRGEILEAGCDAVVAPTNSFAFMDGGLDAALASRFGRELQRTAQKSILANHRGELVVGNAEIVPTTDRCIPYVILAPTMRVPCRLPEGSLSPYLATRGVMALLARLSPTHKPIARRGRSVIRRVALPAFGTGVGGISKSVCAAQVREALLNASAPAMPTTWQDAKRRDAILRQGKRG